MGGGAIMDTELDALKNRVGELEAIAEKLARALEYYEYEAGHALAHPAVIELNNYKREYRKPRPAAVKQSGAAW